MIKNKKSRKHQEAINRLLAYMLLVAVGIGMAYPLLWLFFGSFKSNQELFSGLSLLPKDIVWDSFAKAWKGNGQFTFGHFMMNTFRMVLPTVFFTVVSSAVVAYGFARYEFPLKKILFTIMISTMMLPQSVIIIPRYILFKNLGWLDSYLPFIAPATLASYPFFIFMLIQFFRGIPKELDEAAYIDGCNTLEIFLRILLPLSKPALFSVAIFQFIWTWSDFFNSLIYINSIKKYNISLALRMAIDSTGGNTTWNVVLAMTFMGIIPPLLIFFFAQKYFVEGIATSGLKG